MIIIIHIKNHSGPNSAAIFLSGNFVCLEMLSDGLIKIDFFSIAFFELRGIVSTLAELTMRPLRCFVL